MHVLSFLAHVVFNQLIRAIELKDRIELPGTLVFGGLFPVHSKNESITGGPPCGDIMEGRGIHRVAAMLFAIERINNDTNLLPGITLGARILDTCGHPNYALNASLAFVRDMIGYDSSQLTCPNNESVVRMTPVQPLVGVIGASYSSVTTMVANLLRLFHVVQISPAATSPELSDKSRYDYFARTVPSDIYQARVLVDLAQYFNWTFVSLIYSEGEYGRMGSEQFRKAADLKNICIAYSEKLSDNTNYVTIAKNLEDAAKLKLNTSNIARHEATGARVVVLFTTIDETVKLLLAVHKLGITGLQWLGADAWETTSDRVVKGAETAAQGALIAVLATRKVPEFEEYFKSWTHETILKYQSTWFAEFWEEKFHCHLRPDVKTRYARPCSPKDRITDQNLAPDDKIDMVIDAVYALAHALQLYWVDKCKSVPGVCASFLPKPSGREAPLGQLLYSDYLMKVNFTEFALVNTFRMLGLHKNTDFLRRNCVHANQKACPTIGEIRGSELFRLLLHNVSFDGITGNKFRFDEKGDGPPYYIVKNYQFNASANRGQYEVVGQWHKEPTEKMEQGILVIDETHIQWSQSQADHNDTPVSRCSVECVIGKVKVQQGGLLCCWVCVECRPDEIHTSEFECKACEPGYWPEATRTTCYNIAERNLDYITWDSAYSLVPCCLAILGLLATGYVTCIFASYNDTPVVKASGRELSYMILGGIAVCYSMTFVLLAKPSAATCAVRRVGVGLGFIVLYAALFVKTNRIYRIFNSARLSAQRPRFISPISQVVITAMLISVQLLGSVIWLIVEVPTTRYVYPHPQPQAVLDCGIEGHWFLVSLLYNMTLVVTCTIYAVKTRMVPENFNEAKFIGFTMYTTCIIWLAFVPIYFGTGNNFRIQTTTMCISISMSATVALVCLFSPKMWIIFMEPHKNVRKPDSKFMGSSKGGGTQSSPPPSACNSPSVYSPLVPKGKQAPSNCRLNYNDSASIAKPSGNNAGAHFDMMPYSLPDTPARDSKESLTSL